MTPAEAEARIGLSSRTLAGWQAVPPMGRAEDTLRMINEEIVLLGQVASWHAENAERAAGLIIEWGNMAQAIRAAAN